MSCNFAVKSCYFGHSACNWNIYDRQDLNGSLHFVWRKFLFREIYCKTIIVQDDDNVILLHSISLDDSNSFSHKKLTNKCL